MKPVLLRQGFLAKIVSFGQLVVTRLLNVVKRLSNFKIASNPQGLCKVINNLTCHNYFVILGDSSSCQPLAQGSLRVVLNQSISHWQAALAKKLRRYGGLTAFVLVSSS